MIDGDKNRGEKSMLKVTKVITINKTSSLLSDEPVPDVEITIKRIRTSTLGWAGRSHRDAMDLFKALCQSLPPTVWNDFVNTIDESRQVRETGENTNE